MTQHRLNLVKAVAAAAAGGAESMVQVLVSATARTPSKTTGLKLDA
jgi:hypothetical protein